jgi:hypothetical protein
MSLDPLTIWPQRYVLRCERRADLDEKLGSLPDHSLYIGSSSNLTNCVCFHFTHMSGTQFTKRYRPIAIVATD